MIYFYLNLLSILSTWIKNGSEKNPHDHITLKKSSDEKQMYFFWPWYDWNHATNTHIFSPSWCWNHYYTPTSSSKLLNCSKSGWCLPKSRKSIYLWVSENYIKKETEQTRFCWQTYHLSEECISKISPGNKHSVI